MRRAKAAAERLLSSVYRRPTEHVETAARESVQALRELGHEQRLELLRGHGAEQRPAA